MNHFTCLTTAERQQLLQHFLAVNQPIDERILACLERVLENAFTAYRELTLIRLDLRFAQAESGRDMPVCFQHTDPEVITRFIASLKSQLSEQAKRKQRQGIRTHPCRLRYLWAQEHVDAPLPHYHLILILNKDAHPISVGRARHIRFSEEHTMNTTACQHTHDHTTPSHRTQTTAPTQSQRVLRLKDMTKKLGIARSTIYDWLNPKSPRYDATFPRSFKIGRHCIGWLEQQVDEWLALRATALLE